MPYLYLLLSIAGELMGTLCLKYAEGFTRPWPTGRSHCRLCHLFLFPVQIPQGHRAEHRVRFLVRHRNSGRHLPVRIPVQRASECRRRFCHRPHCDGHRASECFRLGALGRNFGPSRFEGLSPGGRRKRHGRLPRKILCEGRRQTAGNLPIGRPAGAFPPSGFYISS